MKLLLEKSTRRILGAGMVGINAGELIAETVLALEKHANDEVDNGIEPEQIAKKINQIINTKNPKMHYKVASTLQKLAPIIKFLLPSRRFEKMLNKTYTAK